MASISNTTNYTFCFKGVASSVEELPYNHNYIGDYFVVENREGLPYYLTYIWTGLSWVKFAPTIEDMEPYNELKSKSFDTLLKEDYDKDFESNLKKLEEKTFELQQREKYYGGHSNLNNLTYEFSDKTKKLIDAEYLSSVIKPAEIFAGDSIYSCIKDIANKSNVEIALDGSIGSSVEDGYIDAVYDSWNTALAESGK